METWMETQICPGGEAVIRSIGHLRLSSIR